MSPPSLAHVNPGDRITAPFMNALVDEIISLQEQIDALGTSIPTGPEPVITALEPATEVSVGAELDVIGRNFGVPAQQNIVTLDGTPVTGFLPGSTSTLLKFAVPGIAGLPKQAELVVQTEGTARRSIRVVPAGVLPEGRPTLSDVSGSLGTIEAGHQYTLSFRIDAGGVSIPETYRVEVSYENTQPASVPASAWTGATALIGVGDGQVTVAPATPVTVGAQVTVPAGAASADMRVRVISVHNDPASSAIPLVVPIVVGEVIQTDPRVHTPAIGSIGPAAPFHL